MNQCSAFEGIEAQSVGVIEQDLLALNANLNAATYRFLVLAREFDRRMAWADWGMRSMAHWLGWKCGIGPVAARAQLRVAHALVGLPETVAAFSGGRISYSKVRALSRVATLETEGFFLNIAEHGTAGYLERIVRYAKGGSALDDPQRLQAMVENIACDWYYDDDGMLVLRARLMPDDGARLVAALNAMQQHVPSVPVAARRAMALAAVAEAAVGAEPKGSVPEIVVHVRAPVAEIDARHSGDAGHAGEAQDSREARHTGHGTAHRTVDASAETSAYIDGGEAIHRATLERLCCDAGVVQLMEDQHGEPLSIGRRSRIVPPAIRWTMNARDQGCRFPGCTHEHFLHAHHIQYWSRQGETSLKNLVTVCSFHHTLLHEGGYSVRRLLDGCYEFKTPAGRVIPASAPAMHGGAEDLRADNERHGVNASAETGASQWDGSPVDYHHVMFTFFQHSDLAKHHAMHLE